MKMLSIPILIAMLLLTAACNFEQHQQASEHAEEEHDDVEHSNVVELRSEQMTLAGIVVAPLVRRTLNEVTNAPGEVKLNAYLTSKVTPRITAQIVTRHARLGDHVQAGESLVTLSSIEMAEAQGAWQVAEQEWQRVVELGRETVSERRYTEAHVAREQSLARVSAYGMTAAQIDALLADIPQSRADGTFQLLAPQTGTIVRDDFTTGEFVEPGRALFEISDESRVWVEASLVPDEAFGIDAGTLAWVRIDDEWREGHVVQSHHMLNEVTRTLAVHIEVPNPDEKLHPGLFVDIRIQRDTTVQGLAVPMDAVLRSADGDWEVYVEEEPGHLRPQEVTVIQTVDGMTMIDGIPAGTRVVTQGAFFVQSELAKGGFEVHAH